jgi:hypothetical protein
MIVGWLPRGGIHHHAEIFTAAVRGGEHRRYVVRERNRGQVVAESVGDYQVLVPAEQGFVAAQRPVFPVGEGAVAVVRSTLTTIVGVRAWCW